MYLWNIQELKKIIILNQLSEKYKFYYLFIFIIFFSIFNSISLFFPMEVTILEKVNAVIVIVIQLIGLIIAFKMNGGNEGKEFLTRFICLYVSLCVRFIVFVTIFLGFKIAFMLLLSILVPNQFLGHISNAIALSFDPGIEILFFWRLAIHMREVSTGQLKS